MTLIGLEEHVLPAELMKQVWPSPRAPEPFAKMLTEVGEQRLRVMDDTGIGTIRRAGAARAGEPVDAAACIVMVESATAVNNIEEICSTPGVDAVYIGPADLAIRLGCAPSLGVAPGVHA
jgi:HpcH/HpaI aldolase/citrate lyase family